MNASTASINGRTPDVASQGLVRAHDAADSGVQIHFIETNVYARTGGRRKFAMENT